MFRRFKILLGILITLVVSGIGTGFSVWYFGSQEYTPNINTEMRVDNIEENYIFGREDDVDKTYTIYLFPSTIYEKIYVDYLNGNSNVLPENAFGFFEASLDANGDIVPNVNTSKAVGINGNMNYYSYVTNTYINYTSIINYNMPNVNSSTIDSFYSQFANHTYSNGVTSNNLGIGEPNLPLLSDAYFNEQYNFSNKFKYDKFGARDFLDAYQKNSDNTISIKESDHCDLGRYLPQKIIVSQSITVDDFTKYTREPITSIGDKQNWYNYTFSNWTTFTLNGDSFTYPTVNSSSSQNFLWNFLAGDITSYFDIMQNLDKYADSQGVIRLFPYFSNGKKYDEKTYEYGGRDGIRIKSQMIDSTSDSYRYFMYKNSLITNNNINTYFNTSDTIYAILPNMQLTNDLTMFNVQVDKNNDGAASWGGNWVNLFSNDFVNDFLKNDFLKQYGEGLYNIYVFVGNSEQKDESITAKDFYQTINGGNIIYYATKKDSVWPELSNKNLIVASSTYVTNKYIVSETGGTSKLRPILVAFEKVSEARLFHDLDSSYASENDLTNYIDSIYDSANYFRMYGNKISPYYLGEDGYELGSDDLTENNPYIYIARNVNFTDDQKEKSIFQIRFSGFFNQNITFDLNWSGELSTGEKYNSVVVNPSSDGEYNATQIFTSAVSYFDAVNINVGDDGTQAAFTLKTDSSGNDNRGIYDILIVYNPGGTNPNKIVVFAYRHTINFIKLFGSKNDISVDQNTGLAIHKKVTEVNGVTVESELDSLLWRGKYFIGETLLPTSKSDIQFDVGNGTMQLISLEWAVTNYLTNTLKIDESDFDKFTVKDYVTGEVILYYDNTSTSSGWVSNFRILKNYLLYIEGIVPYN